MPRDPDDPEYANKDEDEREDDRRVGWKDWPGGALAKFRPWRRRGWATREEER